MTSEPSKSTFSESQTSYSAEVLLKAYVDQFRSLLRESVLTITFTKSDGTNRVMNATLRSDVAVPYERKSNRTKTRPVGLIPVWDVDASAWRSIYTHSITEVKVADADCN